MFAWLSNNFWRIFGNRLKCHYPCLYNKQNNTWLLVQKEYIFSCWTLDITHLLCSLVRNQLEHLKICISIYIYTHPCIIHYFKLCYRKYSQSECRKAVVYSTLMHKLCKHPISAACGILILLTTCGIKQYLSLVL